MSHAPESAAQTSRFDRFALLAAPLGVGLIWAYWPTLVEMVRRWSTDPRYAHGYLVPAFALFLLWSRRDRLADLKPQPSGWGLVLIGVALGLRLAGAYYYLGWFEAASLLPALAGLCVLLAGWKSLRWSWPAIAFLAFMMPLPFRLEIALAQPLQRIATKASTYTLQTLGFSALAEGNVIQLEHSRIGVVEACSGLSMLFTFFALASAVLIVMRRPWLDTLLILASVVPIALIVNVARITVTGILHEKVSSRAANIVFHDLAGWFMMPIALGILWAELELLAHLFVEPASTTDLLVPKEQRGDIAPRAPPGPGERPAARRVEKTSKVKTKAIHRMLRNP